ncbi:DNA mismatch repair endonuclease MutL [Metabacillus idriensis]|uniref:DNA mismatch repair protein MutL n=1 Tax=Metabacillus idriensis TaxID=324768 RepID=A0A6I2M9Z4_9BACI|nr:DNA mismatch repair endonuclease MutL [Metabacillus idriensis]MCM3594214.1 DNA mismatch repair endonuclease MutL [Metabacillus idriensis]MRX53756.1 DNA mismatch repair endonuclease MutL [Metabacillus idriensis]OHR64791.1 DNA mismatch repair protein MutL [Bacillus sp. HMSC76G11]
MGKIIRLDDSLSNKIAAGEVVERPASVVKELTENSIDAGSTVIEIHIEEAGLSKIRILDNGDGILPEDCLNAFHRHATSKIKDENDLFRIRTLGFRGEALPSIASVSHIELKTSTGSGAGTRMVLSGGKVEIHEAASSRKGSDLTVTNLFFNTPARLKYVKTVHTELGNITDVVNRLALSNPSISFKLTHNGKQMLHTSGNGDVRQVIAGIYGLAIAKKMIPINLQSLDFEVKGYISLPEITRASRNYISTIVNGRFIKNYPLVKAIQQGYHTLLPIGRFPIVFLEINMDPILVDVNVHPAKMEVRLSKETELNELITAGIKEAFSHQKLIPEAVLPKRKEKSFDEQQTFTFSHAEKKPMSAASVQQVLEKQEIELDEASEPEEDITEQSLPVIEEELETYDEQSADYDEEEPKAAEAEPRVPVLYPIGQMHGTYILAQNETGLYIIDQHAAQERINYEYFKEKVGQVATEVQELLVPITIHYSADEALIIGEKMQALAEVGIFLEPFGGNSFIVRSHPQWFPRGDERELIEEIIQEVLSHKQADIKKLREEAAIMMSCKAAIKANHHLRNDEMFALLETLRKTTDPFTCPHGRPIIIHYSTYEMEKMFKRIM